MVLHCYIYYIADIHENRNKIFLNHGYYCSAAVYSMKWLYVIISKDEV